MLIFITTVIELKLIAKECVKNIKNEINIWKYFF